ncbi:uncharacterized protein LOC125911092 [Panthera uncia]|uniref:uncharacterized protein LOC125911092 n=1 Tax=Panthera uncia TaxID=29064 RepID=UPI0020FFC356|nr:uncharacterized protein LOC125911092 [Panthera uncia]
MGSLAEDVAVPTGVPDTGFTPVVLRVRGAEVTSVPIRKGLWDGAEEPGAWEPSPRSNPRPREAPRLHRKRLICAVTCLRAFPRWAGRFIHGPPPGPRDWSEAACPPAGPITIPPFASRDWCSLGTCRAVPVPALIGSCGARDRQAQGPLRPRRAAVTSPVARRSCDGDRCRSSGPGGRLSGSQGRRCRHRGRTFQMPRRAGRLEPPTVAARLTLSSELRLLPGKVSPGGRRRPFP